MPVAAMVGLDARSINVWTYNLETVPAEKLETIITQTFSLRVEDPETLGLEVKKPCLWAFSVF